MLRIIWVWNLKCFWLRILKPNFSSTANGYPRTQANNVFQYLNNDTILRALFRIILPCTDTHPQTYTHCLMTACTSGLTSSKYHCVHEHTLFIQWYADRCLNGFLIVFYHKQRGKKKCFAFLLLCYRMSIYLEQISRNKHPSFSGMCLGILVDATFPSVKLYLSQVISKNQQCIAT